MNSPKNKKEELNELNSGLPPEASGSPFNVPEGYFEGLAGSIMARIKSGEANSVSAEIAALSPLLAGIDRRLPYSVPEGYFTQTLENLEALTSKEDSLVLSFVEKEGPYQVPAGYFFSFPDQVLERIKQEEGTKKTPFLKRKWARLAVAAAVTGILAISGINYFNIGSSAVGGDAVAIEIKKASTEELSAFIKTTTDVNLVEEQSLALQPSNDIEKILDNVPDSELEAFLEDLPVMDESFELNL